MLFSVWMNMVYAGHLIRRHLTDFFSTKPCMGTYWIYESDPEEPMRCRKKTIGVDCSCGAMLYQEGEFLDVIEMMKDDYRKKYGK